LIGKDHIGSEQKQEMGHITSKISTGEKSLAHGTLKS
ncbi:hypothetical protein TSUD_59270, partial [Trifolium subterraneum]